MVLDEDIPSELDNCTYEIILSNIKKHREILKTLRARWWNMIGHILRCENEPIYWIIGEQIEGKWERPRTSFVKKMIKKTRLTIYTELKRIAGNWI